jgi:hypothetical protein
MTDGIYVPTTEKTCPICRMPWEPDCDVFGCWCCGYNGEDITDPYWQEMKRRYDKNNNC